MKKNEIEGRSTWKVCKAIYGKWWRDSFVWKKSEIKRSRDERRRNYLRNQRKRKWKSALSNWIINLRAIKCFCEQVLGLKCAEPWTKDAKKRNEAWELSSNSKFPFPRLLLDRFVALSLFKGTKNINWITNGKEVEYLHLEKSNQSNSEKKKKKKLDSEHWTLFSTDIRIIQTFVHKER